MLSPEDNELIIRVGPGTPMGNVLRRYWIPALMSRELGEPDGEPVRVGLLGETLLACICYHCYSIVRKSRQQSISNTYMDDNKWRGKEEEDVPETCGSVSMLESQQSLSTAGTHPHS